MEPSQCSSFAEYLKSMKTRPVQKGKARVANRKQRLDKRDELRASKRTYSPLPPTPHQAPRPEPLQKLNESVMTALDRELEAAAAPEQQNVKPAGKSVAERMHKMKKWRAERDKQRAADKAKKKPVFHIGGHAEIPSLVKPLASQNYKFKAPENIQPIAFQRAATGKKPAAKATATKPTNTTASNSKCTKDKENQEHAEKKAMPTRRKLNYQHAAPESSKPGKATKTIASADKQAGTADAADAKPVKVKLKVTVKQMRTAAQAQEAQATKSTSTSTTAAATSKHVPRASRGEKHPGAAGGRPATRALARQVRAPDGADAAAPAAPHPEPQHDGAGGGVAKKAGRVKAVVPKTPKTPKTPKSPKSPKSPTKTPKTPKSLKTPKAAKRRSAGRTPARRLTHKELDESLEEANEAKSPVKEKEAKELLSAGSTDSASTVFPYEGLDSTFTVTDEDDNHKTPDDKGDVPVYVSPFVTMSRGKMRARSEYKSRVSKGGECLTSPDATGIKAGSAYFYKLLDDEIVRIRALCDQWEEYKLTAPEEACSMINVATGQANLLITKKMQQFRALIDKSVISTDGLSVTCADLHGFWDTVMIQVHNLNQRFAYLVALRANAWREVLPAEAPEVKAKVKRVMPKRTVKAAAPAAAGSKIRDLIKAARRNNTKNLQVQQENGTEFNGGFFSIKSPVKQPSAGNTPRKTPMRACRMSLLKSVLHSANRKSRGSPGLAMMKATQGTQRLVDGDADRDSDAASRVCTPTKSILKVSTPKSAVKKAVIFKEKEAVIHDFEPLPHEHLEHFDHLEQAEHDENDCNMENVPVQIKAVPVAVKTTPRRSDARTPRTPLRRSRRLSGAVYSSR